MQSEKTYTLCIELFIDSLYQEINKEIYNNEMNSIKVLKKEY